MTKLLTIIIPVYNALEDLKACLDSLWQYTPAAVRVHIVNDASPDPAISEYLNALPAKEGLTVVHREKNLGFTGNINSAMRETDHWNEDVVWLNTDTLLTPHWLEGMLSLARRAPRAASITPFSNNAEICSYPKFVHNNPVPPAPERQWLAEACQQISAFDYPLIELPTGVGFCMLVRRQAWREVGELDAEAFGRGYGEENDWCQRALKQGWQHLFCPATFVVHKGGQSFSADKAALVQKNSQVLNARHPGYDLEVQKFIAKDPIKTWRAMLTHQLDIKKTAGSILHIVHGKEGGVLRHVADIRAQVPDMSHVVLKAMENVWWLEIADTRYEFVRQPDQLWSDYLQQICACFDVRFIHLHHWVTCAEGLRLALAETHLPYGVTLHDFYTSCPLVHLINSQEQYCQAPTEVSTCSQCLAQDTVKHSVKIAPYRQAHEQLLQHAKFVLAPSQFTQRVLQQYFSAIDIKVVPHSVNSPAYEPRRRDLQGERTRVAVVGAIGPVKGARQLEQLAQYLQQQQADWELHLIGYLDTHFHPGVLYGGYLHIHGAYPQNQLAAHLHRHHTAVVLFPSLGPETYSYTLSDVWLAGLSVVCTDVGTVAERVRSCDGGWVLSKPTSAKDWQSTWVQEIAQILSAENAELRKAKAERGQKSIIAEQAIMPSRLQAYYHENRGESMEAQAKPDASQQVAALRWQALQSETQVNHTSTKITWPRRIILFLLRYALACRRTRLGRSLETMMPSHLKHRLRASLLAH